MKIASREEIVAARRELARIAGTELGGGISDPSSEGFNLGLVASVEAEGARIAIAELRRRALKVYPDDIVAAIFDGIDPALLLQQSPPDDHSG